MVNLEKLVKEEGKGGKKINCPRYINNLVSEMMRLEKTFKQI